ncbi:MAG: GGDEF domain-containing protein [Nitrospirae bacterium]|nr:GGDEF domain-containing protein [Nitrospirota bacterium]
MGGEEFAVLLSETDIAGGEIFAENIRKTVEAYDFNVVGKVTASFGVSCLITNGQDMLDMADKALYFAKNEGRDKVVCKA